MTMRRMHVRTSSISEPITSERPDVRLGVRDADLPPKVRELIANVHAQIKEVTDRYGVADIRALQTKLLAGSQKDRFAAKEDIVQLLRLTTHLRTLWENEGSLGEAFQARAASEALASEATDGSVFDAITILKAASEKPPQQLKILTPVLETHLLNGQHEEVKRDVARIAATLLSVLQSGDDNLHNLPKLTADAFRVLGKFGERQFAEHMLSMVFQRVRANYWANYAAGLAEAGKVDEADEAFAEAEQRVPDTAMARVYAYAALARALHSVGRDAHFAVAAAEQALEDMRHEPTFIASFVPQLTNTLMSVCAEIGDSAAVRRMSSDEGILAIVADCRRGDFSTIHFDATQTEPMRRLIAREVLPILIAARAWTHVTPILAWNALSPLDLVHQVADKVSLAEYEQFLQIHPVLLQNSVARFCHAKLLVREGMMEEAANIVDDLRNADDQRYLDDMEYPALLYRLGREQEAMACVTEGMASTTSKVLLANAMRPDRTMIAQLFAGINEDSLKTVQRRATLGSTENDRAFSSYMFDLVVLLLENDFIDEARECAKKIHATAESGHTFCNAWVRIGAWYANKALEKAKEASHVLQKVGV